jgi:hypothetical protein
MRAQLKTVEDILLTGENLEIGSDSDISDASQIRTVKVYQSNLKFADTKHNF